MSKTKSSDATRIDALLSWLGQREDEMAALNALDDGTRFRPDPETYTGT